MIAIKGATIKIIKYRTYKGLKLNPPISNPGKIERKSELENNVKKRLRRFRIKNIENSVRIILKYKFLLRVENVIFLFSNLILILAYFQMSMKIHKKLNV